MSTDENKAIVRRFIEEVINKRNAAAIDELVAPNYAYRFADGTPPEGRDVEWLRAFVPRMVAGLPDATLSVEETLAEGDLVAARVILRGTHTGDLTWGPLGSVLKATGKPVAVGAVIITRVVGGKIVADWEAFEFASLWRQLGAIPAPAPAAT